MSTRLLKKLNKFNFVFTFAGTTTEPQSLSGRILALIVFGAFMFIYVSYSANIVVLLQSTTKINTIEELVESRITAGGCDTHYMKNYFEVKFPKL